MRLLKIGRDKSNNIVLPSPRVSSTHAEITILNNGDMLLEDKNSLNGTFVIAPALVSQLKAGSFLYDSPTPWWVLFLALLHPAMW